MVPDSVTDQMLTAAIAHHEAGRLPQAESLYRQILQREPLHAEALHLLGVLAGQVNQPEAGRELILRAMQLNPREARYPSNLGQIYRGMKQFQAAIDLFRQAVALDPRFYPAQYNLASMLREAGRPEEAVAECRTAAVLQPDMPHPWYTLGNAYGDQRLFPQAEEAYLKAIALRPAMYEAWNNLGHIYQEQGLHGKAEEAFQRVVALAPTFARGYYNLGISLQKQSLPAESVRAYDQAVACDPGFPDAHWNLAFALLTLGQFERGWEEFEWRWQSDRFPSPIRDFAQPLWNGEDLQGKTILLHAEQGFGDAIEFVRYVRLVAQRNPARIILECQRELLTLFRNIPGISQIFECRGALPPPVEFDTHAPFLSLPRAFHTTLDSIPSEVPYLRAAPEQISRFRDLLHSSSTGEPGPGPLRVGLVWAGRPTHIDDRDRTLPLADFTPLFQVPGVSWVSLQLGPAAAQIASARLPLLDLSAHIHDFSDTAALIANLDLVIGIDTGVMHLVGSLARPGWLLLPRRADWRWLLERTDSPWYPTLRLFRGGNGSGADLMARVAGELQTWRAGAGGGTGNLAIL